MLFDAWSDLGRLLAVGTLHICRSRAHRPGQRQGAADEAAVAWLAVRLPAARRTFRSAPTLLLGDGEFLAATLLHQQIGSGGALGDLVA